MCSPAAEESNAEPAPLGTFPRHLDRGLGRQCARRGAPQSTLPRADLRYGWDLRFGDKRQRL